jgi:predicted nucleic acid-binding protein
MSSPNPVPEFVSDTMALVRRVDGKRLGAAAENAYVAAESGNGIIDVPGIVFAEIMYLVEKKRIKITLTDVTAYLTRNQNIREYPLSFAVVNATADITDIRELHDRLIAGTARLLQRPLITNDPNIQASKWVQTIW